MLDHRLRRHQASALGPAVARLQAVPAGRLTGIGLVVGVGAAGSAAAGWWPVAVVAWLANRLIDGLDGEVARQTGTASDRGGYADLLADVTVYAALPIGVAAGVGSSAAWVAAAVLLATFYLNVVSLLVLAAIRERRSWGAAARGETTTITMPAGLVEGAETAIAFAVILAVPGWAPVTMAVMAAAVAATAAGRVIDAWPSLGPPPPAPITVPHRRPGVGR